MERHAALPDVEDFQRMREVVIGLVEKHVAQPPAEDHAEHGEEQEVVELDPRYRRHALANAVRAEPPAGREADEIHQAVPAHRERADGERDRVYVGMDEHRYSASRLA